MFCNKMKNIITLFVFSTLLLSCKAQKLEEDVGFSKGKESYDKLKDESIDVFLNLSVALRWFEQDDELKAVAKIQVNDTSGSYFLNIPGDKNNKKVPIQNLEKFAKHHGINKDKSVEFAENTIEKVIEICKSHKILKTTSLPHLGQFIEFQITYEDYVIYCPDTLKVYEEFWKDFFKHAKKFDDFWYYRKEGS